MSDDWQTPEEMEAHAQSEAVAVVREWIAALGERDYLRAMQLSDMNPEEMDSIRGIVVGTDEWAVGSRPRPIRPAVEDVILIDPATSPAYVTGPTVVRAVKLRVRHTDDGCRVAAFVHADGSTSPPGR